MKLIERSEKPKKLRAENMVIGVIYGKKIQSTPIQVEYKDFIDHYRQYGKSRTFKVKLTGKSHQVYIKELQIDPINRHNILHFDLIKVSATDTITADIPVIVLNKEIVEEKGYIVQLIASTVLTEYSVSTNISRFQIDVSEMEKGEAKYVKDIELAEGLKILDDPEKMIINVTEPTYEVEEEVTDEEEDATEVEAFKQKDEAPSEKKDE